MRTSIKFIQYDVEYFTTYLIFYYLYMDISYVEKKMERIDAEIMLQAKVLKENMDTHSGGFFTLCNLNSF